jgi:hypothetical protein
MYGFYRWGTALSMMRDDSSIPAGLCKTICYSPDLGRTIYVMSGKQAK